MKSPLTILTSKRASNVTGTRIRARERRVQEILERIADGESLVKICAPTEGNKKPITTRTWYRWLQSSPELLELYQGAVSARADNLFDEIIEIADAPARMVVETVHRGKEVVTVERIDIGYEHQRKTMIDARKFTVARLAPKKYGDRMTSEITGADGGAVLHAVQIYIPDNARDRELPDREPLAKLA